MNLARGALIALPLLLGACSSPYVVSDANPVATAAKEAAISLQACHDHLDALIVALEGSDQGKLIAEADNTQVGCHQAADSVRQTPQLGFPPRIAKGLDQVASGAGDLKAAMQRSDMHAGRIAALSILKGERMLRL